MKLNKQLNNMNNIIEDGLKVALISFQKDAERIPPVGLVYLATYLRDKCGIKNIKIIDKNFDNIETEIEKFSPDIIGIGPMTIYYQEAIRFSISFKKIYNIPIILGGVHISTLPESLKPCFDLAVIGEGEGTALQVSEKSHRQMHYVRSVRFMILD